MTSFDLHSADVDDLPGWSPPPGTSWEVNIQVLFHGESFQFQLCSLEWLAQRLATDGCVLTGRRAVVKDYSFGSLVSAIERVVCECERTDWDAFATRLNWYMQWEFENAR